MPHVIVKLWPGKSEQQKMRLAEEITRSVTKVLNYGEESVSVAFMQAIRSARPGGSVGYVGVPHGVELSGEELFFSHVHLHGGPAPVRRFLPELIELVWSRKIEPGRVFDLSLPLEKVAEGYRAMDERRAIKALLRP